MFPSEAVPWIALHRNAGAIAPPLNGAGEWTNLSPRCTLVLRRGFTQYVSKDAPSNVCHGIGVLVVLAVSGLYVRLVSLRNGLRWHKLWVSAVFGVHTTILCLGFPLFLIDLRDVKAKARWSGVLRLRLRMRSLRLPNSSLLSHIRLLRRTSLLVPGENVAKLLHNLLVGLPRLCLFTSRQWRILICLTRRTISCTGGT